MAWTRAAEGKCTEQAESGYILKIEPTGLADKSDMKWRREGG